MNNVMSKISPTQCVGCELCKSICPTGAISFSGKKINSSPIVDLAKCIDCGKCLNYCPIFKKDQEQNRFGKQFYVCNSKDIDIIMHSSSGGLFGEIVKALLDDSTMIAGAVYNDDYTRVKHIISNKSTDIEKMHGSKYFRSSLEDVYRNIRNLLNEGCRVVFFGTGCQCAAIKSLCGTETKNLYLVQIICKGIMPNEILKSYISNLEKREQAKIKKYSMRHKEENKGSNELIVLSNGYSSIKPLYETQIGKLYASDLLIRDSCFHCKFRGDFLVGDLVIGDYSADNDLQNSKLGSSTVVINSDKGNSLFHLLNINSLPITESNAKMVCKRIWKSPYKLRLVNRKAILSFDMEKTPIDTYVSFVNKRYPFMQFQRKVFTHLEKYWKKRT